MYDDIESRKELVELLAEEGYIEGVPCYEVYVIDNTIAKTRPCPRCSQRSCEYVGFISSWGSYRAFQWCQECRTASEF